MNAFRFRVSLLLNGVLAAAALALSRSEPLPATPVETNKEVPIAPVRVGPSKHPQYADVLSAADQRRWLVDQLRAMGVPNKVLARVVLKDFDQRWNRRASEISLKCHGNPDTLAALQLEIDACQDSEMRAALGEEDFRQWDQENMLREVNEGKAPLTAAETGAAYDLWKARQQQELEFRRTKLKGEMDDADFNDLVAKADVEFKQQLASLLGDDRYAQSQETDGESLAKSLRQDFARANPSDHQFQDLLKTQQRWIEQRAALDKQIQDNPSSADYTDQIKALDEARELECRRVLGPDVFDTFQKEQDLNYARMKKYKVVWGLNDEKIDGVYGTIRYYEKSVQDYQRQARSLESQGRIVDWDAVNQNLRQFGEQTRQALKSYLDPESFDKLQRNGIFQFDQ